MNGLEKITSPGGASFWVAKPHAERFRGLIGDLEAAGYGIKGKESGGYNYRNIAGTNKLSQHAHGAAIDINWNDNARGTAGNIPAELARQLAQKHGLKWGGDWKNPDPMHFEVPGQPGHTYGDGHNHGAPPAAMPSATPAAPATGAAPAMTPYTGPSPDDVSQSRRMAQLLMQQGASTEPVQHWTQALARVLQGGVGGMYQAQAKQGEQQGTQAMVQALSGGGQPNVGALVSNPWTRQFGMELAKSQFAQNTPMAQAQLAHAQGEEQRARELQPLKVQAQQAALEASSIGQLDPDKITYRKKKDGTFEVINPGGVAGPSPATLKSEAELRKEYIAQPQIKEYQTVRNAYQNVKSSAKDPSAAGDLAMIFAFMKMLDPNSVVREQEFANAQNAAGVPDRIRNVYNRIMSGERLNPEQRKDFLAQADKLHGSSQRQYEAVRKQYGTIAERAKARPDQVTIDFSEVQEETAPAVEQPTAAPASAAPQATPAPRAQPAQAQIAPPDAIKRLRANPTPQERKMFDEVFGPGASARALALRPR